MRVIESVEVISQHPEGTDTYRLGMACRANGPKVADITEHVDVISFWDANDNLLMEIRNCPVIIKYRDEE